MKTHFLKQPLRRRMSGWQRVREVLRHLLETYHSARIGG